MKKKVQVGIATLAVCALSLIAQPAFASPTVAFYSFSGVNISASSIYSNEFSVTNPYHVVTIKGWQDTSYPNTPSNFYYYVVQKGAFLDTTYGTWNATQNYPQSGMWYSYTFNNIPYNNGTYYYRIKSVPNVNISMSGAGNAYDGY